MDYDDGRLSARNTGSFMPEATIVFVAIVVAWAFVDGIIDFKQILNLVGLQ